MHTHVADTSQRSKRILLVRTDRLGDVVLTLPMLPVLRKRFPDAYIALLLNKYTAELVEGNPHADELILYDDGRQLVPFSEMLRTIRTKDFGTAIVVHPTPRLAWLMFRAGIPERIGSGYRYYSLLFDKRVYEHRKDAKRHELDYNLSLLKPLGCSIQGEPSFSLVIPPDVEARVQRLFASLAIDTEKEIIVLHPGTGGSAKEWPAEFFGQLAARLVAERGAQILVTGTRDEERKVTEVTIAAKDKAISLVGRLSLKELSAVISRADLFISNSTGPLHIAVACRTPVVGLFGPTSPARNGPIHSQDRVVSHKVPCGPCYKRTCEIYQKQCMRLITVEEVFQAILRRLNIETNQGVN